MINKFYSACAFMIAAFALLSIYIQPNASFSLIIALLYFAKAIGVVLVIVASVIFLSLIHDLHKYYDRELMNDETSEYPDEDITVSKYTMYPQDEPTQPDFWK